MNRQWTTDKPRKPGFYLLRASMPENKTIVTLLEYFVLETPWGQNGRIRRQLAWRHASDLPYGHAWDSIKGCADFQYLQVPNPCP